MDIIQGETPLHKAYKLCGIASNDSGGGHSSEIYLSWDKVGDPLYGYPMTINSVFQLTTNEADPELRFSYEIDLGNKRVVITVSETSQNHKCAWVYMGETTR